MHSELLSKKQTFYASGIVLNNDSQHGETHFECIIQICEQDKYID